MVRTLALLAAILAAGCGDFRGGGTKPGTEMLVFDSKRDVVWGTFADDGGSGKMVEAPVGTRVRWLNHQFDGGDEGPIVRVMFLEGEFKGKLANIAERKLAPAPK